MFIARAGKWETELVPHGKKRGEKVWAGWSLRLAAGGDGSVVGAVSKDSVELQRIDTGKCIFELEVEDPTVLAIDGSRFVFGTESGAVYVVDYARLGITIHRPDWSTIVLQPPASELVIDKPPKKVERRAKGDGKDEHNRGWERWHIFDDGPKKPTRYVHLPDEAKELTVLKNGALAMLTRKDLRVLSKDLTSWKVFAGHGGWLEALWPSADGRVVTVSDTEGQTRRWQIED